MAMRVESKTAIVTGAGSGINLCFAKLLLSKGCNVVFADLALRPEAEAVVAQYPLTSPQGTAKAVFQKTDVTDWAQLDKMFEVAIEHFGGADIVCPGAGVFEPPFSNFWYPPGQAPSKDKISESRYALIDINITHPIRTTQLAITHFLERKKPGVITHISSIAAQAPSFPTPIYAASKHAISGFVRSLSQLEFPTPDTLPKIRVNAVAPALIKTPLWTDHPEKMKIVGEDCKWWVTPEAVADVMLDLVENDEHVGGTVLEVDSNRVRKVEAINDPGPARWAEEESRGRIEEDTWACLMKVYDGK